MRKILLLIVLFISAFSFAQPSDSSKIKLDTTLIKAQFPGGENAWIKYIQKLIEKKIDIVHEDSKSRGTAEVQFTVGIDGTVSNLKVISLEGSVLATVLSGAILNGPRWIPAMRNNEFVESKHTQKVTFQVYDQKEEKLKRRERRKAEGS